MYILGIESSCDETSIAIIEFNEKPQKPKSKRTERDLFVDDD